MAKVNKRKGILDLIKQAVVEVFEELDVITRKDLSYLPSKEEYFEREDKAMGKLKKIEEELSILSDHSSNHSDRIEALEKIHPHGHHLPTN
jgi:hypothetical protein